MHRLNLQSSPAGGYAPAKPVADPIPQNRSPDRRQNRQAVVGNVCEIRVDEGVRFSLVRIQIAKFDGRIHRNDIVRHLLQRYNTRPIEFSLKVRKIR